MNWLYLIGMFVSVCVLLPLAQKLHRLYLSKEKERDRKKATMTDEESIGVEKR